MPSNLDGNDESRDFLYQMKIVAAIGCFLIFLFSLRCGFSLAVFPVLGVGLLIAGAALLSGFLLGFIFTIPRVGGSRGKDTTAPAKGSSASSSSTQYDSAPSNDNLVEISDWLTKIILGVGLVELKSIAGNLGNLSYFLAVGLRPINVSILEPILVGQTAGLAILIFYFTLGFLLGSVWTMIYFQRDLKGKLKDAEQQTEAERRQKRIANRIQWIETCLNEKQFDKAMASIDEALKSDPLNGLFVMTKARILKRKATQPGQSDRNKLLNEALACADQAIALLPETGEPLYNKACYQALLDPAALKISILENLKGAFRLNPGLRQNAKDDEDLASLKHDADFVKLTG